jgi:ribosomal protein L17
MKYTEKEVKDFINKMIDEAEKDRDHNNKLASEYHNEGYTETSLKCRGIAKYHEGRLHGYYRALEAISMLG